MGFFSANDYFRFVIVALYLAAVFLSIGESSVDWCFVVTITHDACHGYGYKLYNDACYGYK